MSLSSLIVQREIATIRQVEEALARQVLYGGDLVTNLLEVASTLQEQQLAAVIAASFGKEPAAAGVLPVPSPEALAMIPSELANRRNVFPIHVDQERLLLAVSEPLPREEEEGLAFALGVRIDSQIALFPRVREAIAKVYGIPVDRRVERLLTKLGGGETKGPTSRPPLLSDPPTITNTERVQSVPPFRLSPAYGVQVAPVPPASEPFRHVQTNAGFPAPMLNIPIGEQALPEVHQAVTVPPPLESRREEAKPAKRQTAEFVSPPAPATPQTFAKATGNAVRPVRRRRGPLTFELAKEELEAAVDRDALLDLFFEFARQFFDYSALFIAHGDLAEGRDAFGDGAAREHVVGIGVPLDMPSLLATARDSRAVVYATLGAQGVDAVLAHDLERKIGTEALALPVLVRGRPVAILYGDAGDAGIDRASIADVLQFGALAGQGFEKLIVRKKLAGFSAATPGTQAGRADLSAVAPISKRAPSNPPPDKAARAEALASALGAKQSDRPGAFRPAAVLPSGDRRPPTNPETPSSRGAMPDVLNPDSAAPPPVAPPIEEPRSIVVVSPSSPPIPLGRPIVTRDRGSKPPPPNLAVVRPLRPPIPREEDAPDDEEPIALTGPRISSPVVDLHLDAPAIVTADEVGDEEAAALLAEIEASEADEAAETMEADEPEGPSSVAIPPHRPPSKREVTPSSSLPSVIIDMDQETLALVDRVAFGQDDGQGEGELLRQGQYAMPAIMARFPGPLTVDRSQLSPPLPKASECGTILRLVARQRRVALPFVLTVAASDDVSVRFWATFLLAELPYLEGVPVIVARMYDPDPRVRMAARAAAKATTDVAHEALLAEIGKVLRDTSATRGARIGVIEALGEMREPLAAPVLIRALGDKDEEIATVARRSLITITRQDFQRDDKRWLSWWGLNSARHRIEWLIDALTDETPGIRRAASDELKNITGETFGYYEDLPKRDRERAQQRFRDWWAQEGKMRFAAGP